MEKNSKEALQVAKELTCKFIETRTVTPGNFAEIFPVIFQVVYNTIYDSGKPGNGLIKRASDPAACNADLTNTSSNTLSNKQK